jgi:hypothetical protein
MLVNSSLNNIFSTLLAVRENLPSIQNGQDDFQNPLSKNHSQELTTRQVRCMNSK